MTAPLSRLVSFCSIFALPMSRRSPRAVALLAVLSLLLVGGGGCGSESRGGGSTDSTRAAGSATKTTTAKAPPDSSLVSVSEFDLDDYEGQVVLLNFWATWCAPCRAEMPDLVDLQDDLRSEGLRIVGVAMDQSGKEAVVPYLKQQPVNYPIVTDPKATIGERYGGIPALPTTLLIGPDGEVRERIVGRVQPQSLRKRLGELLAGTAPAPPAADSANATATESPVEMRFVKAGAP